jgi:TRAP-type mannitol/chloroaromatic compound transport system permease small subunit
MKKQLSQIGKTFSWLCLVIIIMMCFDVLMRYLFNSTQVWLIELEWYFFGALFLMTGAWTMLEDRHVRVDVFYSGYTTSTKEWVNLLGHLFLTLPWVAVVIYASFKYATYSWQWSEGSPDPGGLPARYVVKYLVTLGFVLMMFATFIKLFEGLKSSKSG